MTDVRTDDLRTRTFAALHRRIPDPVVRSELAYLEAQQAKRAASTRLSEGDVSGALRHLRDGAGLVAAAMSAAPRAMMAPR